MSSVLGERSRSIGCTCLALSGLIDHFIAVTSDFRNKVVCSTGDFRGDMDLFPFANTPVVPGL